MEYTALLVEYITFVVMYKWWGVTALTQAPSASSCCGIYLLLWKIKLFWLNIRLFLWNRGLFCKILWLFWWNVRALKSTYIQSRVIDCIDCIDCLDCIEGSFGSLFYWYRFYLLMHVFFCRLTCVDVDSICLCTWLCSHRMCVEVDYYCLYRRFLLHLVCIDIGSFCLYILRMLMLILITFVYKPGFLDISSVLILWSGSYTCKNSNLLHWQNKAASVGTLIFTVFLFIHQALHLFIHKALYLLTYQAMVQGSEICIWGGYD